MWLRLFVDFADGNVDSLQILSESRGLRIVCRLDPMERILVRARLDSTSNFGLILWMFELDVLIG